MIIPNESRGDAHRQLTEALEVLGCEYSNEEGAKLAESIVVKHAYSFFNIFKLLLSDLFYSHEERLISRSYFHKVSAVDALRVISVELHFLYEVLHTKVLAIRSKGSYIFRFIAFTEVAMAFVLFNRFKKHQLPKLDAAITYILLFGGIAIDVITLFILIFSDWTVAQILHYKTGPSEPDSFLLPTKIKLRPFLHKLMSATDDLRKPRFATCKVEPNTNATYAVLDTPFIFRRWSESISACNIFSELLKESPRKMHKRDQCWGIIAFSNICSLPFRMAGKIISLFHRTREIFIGTELSILAEIPRYKSKNPFINELWIFIFREVRRKSIDARDPTETRKIFEARGDLFLQGRPGGIDLLVYVTKPTYDISVIVWHVATEICYRRENPTERNDAREFSKILSDYMLYLLLNQPNVVSSVAGFAKLNVWDMTANCSTSDAEDLERQCKAPEEHPPDIYSDSTDTITRGFALAQKMESFGETKWEVMSGVWVEMLSYAAGHIKGEAHVQVLSKGGELLAFVWLLMAHFGCLCKPEWGIYEDYMFRTEPETELDDDDDISVETQLV